MRRLAVALCVVALAAGCGAEDAPEPEEPRRSAPPSIVLDSPDPEPTTESSPTAKPVCAIETANVTMTYEAATQADGGVTITAHSNLPDGSELMAGLQQGDYGSQTFMAQDKAILEGGSATFGPFTNKGEPLSGSYLLSISMSIARLQSPEVQACIGENGEHLKGPLVRKSEIEGGNSVDFERKVTLG